jgi:hypothetical protein
MGDWMSVSGAELDSRLWVRLRSGQLGLLEDGSQGSCGAFLVFLPSERRSATVRLPEISRCSVEASYWLRGLLAGSVPSRWFEVVETVRDVGSGWAIQEDPRESLYQLALRRLRATGVWRIFLEENCSQCDEPYFPMSVDAGTHLPSDPYELCWHHDLIDLEALWPEVSAEPGDEDFA